jgi:hypothetical protein
VTGLKHSCGALSAGSFAALTFYDRWRDVAGDPAQVLILPFSSGIFAARKWSGWPPRGGRRAVTGLKHSCGALSAGSFAALTFCDRWRDVAGDPAQVLILHFSSSIFAARKWSG